MDADTKHVWKIVMSTIGGVMLIILILGLSLSGCSWLTHYPEDNVVEEIVEHIIHEETGLDLDLSPASPETPP